MAKVTIKDLQEKIVRLEVVADEANLNVKKLVDKDNRLRREFTNVIGPHEYEQSNWGHDIQRVPRKDTMSWEEIFFAIGELNSDANYSILLERKRELEREISELKEKAIRLESPDTPYVNQNIG